MNARCTACGDPSHPGDHLCRVCRAWAELPPSRREVLTAHRCGICNDPCGAKHRHCVKCRAWANLGTAQARDYFGRLRARRAEPLDARPAKLARRIADLEVAVGFIADREYVANLEACR